MLVTRTFITNVRIYQTAGGSLLKATDMWIPNEITVEVGHPRGGWARFAYNHETAIYAKVSVPIKSTIVNGWIETRDLAVDVLAKLVTNLPTNNEIDKAVVTISDAHQALALYRGKKPEDQVSRDARIIRNRLVSFLGH